MSEEYLNSSAFTQIEELGEIFNIPVASGIQQVWFIRTSGGDFYDDFRFNNYVAIGWDKIPAEWIIKKPLFAKVDDKINDEKIPLLPLSEKEFKRRVKTNILGRQK